MSMLGRRIWEAHADVDRLRELFVGGGCESGNYALTELNEVDNAITDVAVDEHTVDDRIEPDRTYHLHVYAEDRRVNLASFHGTDGNGYYGTGFWIEIEDGEHR